MQLSDLAIVIPAYNEEARLPSTFAELDRFLDSTGQDIELVLVDDGSEDATRQIMQNWTRNHATARVLALAHAGKAHAVKQGVASSTRGRVLFMDADLAVPLDEIPKLVEALDAGADVAIGSRELHESVREGEPGIRRFRGRAFNWFVQAFAVRGIRDTQCGFKAFTRDAAGRIFALARLHATPKSALKGPSVTAFDVELLYIARRLGLRVAEVPVRWQHVPESKVRPVLDPLRMTLDVLQIRFNALIGRYPHGPRRR